MFIFSAPTSTQVHVAAMRKNGIYLRGILKLSPLAFFKLQVSILTQQALKRRIGVLKVPWIFVNRKNQRTKKKNIARGNCAALFHDVFVLATPFPPRHLNKKTRGVGIQVRDPSEWILIKFLNLIQERARSHCKKWANPRSRIMRTGSQMIK